MMVNRFREVTMGAAIALREDYDAADLRRIAKGSKDAAQSRRLLSLAEIYAGGRRTDAARIGATDLQVIRDWVLRFNALGPSGLLDRKAPGNPPKLDTAQRQALAAIVESGPIPALHGVVRWRLIDLRHWIWQEFAVSMDERSVGRILRAMNFVKMTARPRHRAQNEWALEDFKKTSPPVWQRSAKPWPPIQP
jgi:transposase